MVFFTHTHFSLSHISSSVLTSVITVHSLFIFGSMLDPLGWGVSDASIAVCAASAARQGVGGVVELGRGKGGGRGVGGGGCESTGFTGQSQLPQGIQGIHLSSP